MTKEPKLLGAPEDSVPLDLKIFHWLEATPHIKYRRVNEMPWGSYRLAITSDGENYIATERFWGWGYDPPKVFSIILEEHVKSGNIPKEFEVVFSDEEITELLSLNR